MKSNEVTHEDLLAFVAGEADSETKRRIAEEMDIEGSFTQGWLRRLYQAAKGPFDIQWGHLVSSGKADPEVSETRVGSASSSEGTEQTNARELPLPTVLDCLAVLWEEAAGGQGLLTLPDVYRRVSTYRRQRGESIPTVVAVSEGLDRAVARGLLREVSYLPFAESSQISPFGRGGLDDSVQTAFQAVHRPGPSFMSAYQSLISNLRPQERPAAFLREAQALALPEELLAELEKWMKG